MPFVRDFAFNYTTATGTSIVVPMPAYVQGDLLIAVMTSDGPQTNTSVTATGWTQLGYWNSSTTNACNMNILVKYAGASETDVTFTMATETLNGTIVSIGDCFNDGGTGVNSFEAVTANVTAATNSATWTTARAGFPALTTTGADRLILYTAVGTGTTATGVVSIIEGACTLLVGKDGSAHCDGIAWGFKKSAGTIAANSVYAQVSGTASAAGFMTQMAIKPPAGGAAVIPTYCTSDLSKLINLGTGAAHSTVYGNTSATGAVASFSGTLNGKSITAAGATYTYQDKGINSYHPAIGLLGLATSGTWAVNETSHSAMTDLAGANILLHVGPNITSAIQTTDGVGLTGTCGMAVGLASTSGNWKAWHVHGSGTPWGAMPDVPIVVNTDNTSGVIQTTGTLATNSITKLGLFVSGKVVAPQWCVYSIWKLDTTVVVGGNAAYPMTVPDIIRAASLGHERKSIISQGAGQMLIFQPLQIGNGGTDIVYCDLKNTATEFPRQYNKALKQINYCSVDNKCGISFYVGASDYFNLTNAVFSSPNKYTWGFNASSAAGTVITTGCLVIGAGTITLANNVNLSNMTFSGCDQITAATNTLTAVTFDSTNTSTGAISITGGTGTALQTALDRLVTCTWKNNTVGLRIIYSGSGNVSLNMSSHIFSGNTKDIRWEAGSGQTLTVNYSNMSLPTGETSNSTSITFSAAVTITIDADVTLVGAEVRVYDLDGAGGTDYGTELAGTESHTSADYQFTGNAGNNILVQIMKSGYQEYTQSYTMPTSNQTYTVTLLPDINS